MGNVYEHSSNTKAPIYVIIFTEKGEDKSNHYTDEEKLLRDIAVKSSHLTDDYKINRIYKIYTDGSIANVEIKFNGRLELSESKIIDSYKE